MKAAKRIIPGLVRRYAEEASFLWVLRERAVRSPNHAAEDMARLEERLEAQLDGLRLAGTEGWELVKEELAWKEPGEVFTGAVLAMQSGNPAHWEDVAGSVAGEAKPARSLIAALGWTPWARAESLVKTLGASDAAVMRYAAVGGASVHRQWIPGLMASALRDAEPLVRARALKACGESGRLDLLPAVAAAVGDKDEACRFWASWSSLLLGRQEAKAELFAWAKVPGPFRLRALSLAVRAASLSEALAWLDSLGESETRLRMQGLGWVGAASRVPWLIEQTRKPEMARQAGAALTWITGMEFHPGHLGVLPAPDLEEALEEQGLAESADSDWNWPNPARTEAWWKASGSKFAPEKAYLSGQPKSKDAFLHLVQDGMQCHRLGAALDLGLLKTGAPMPECRSRAA
ncbi:MAG: TIGR02270 family protein [Fibrobacteria bacterium]